MLGVQVANTNHEVNIHIFTHFHKITDFKNISPHLLVTQEFKYTVSHKVKCYRLSAVWHFCPFTVQNTRTWTLNFFFTEFIIFFRGLLVVKQGLYANFFKLVRAKSNIHFCLVSIGCWGGGVRIDEWHFK